MRAIRLFLILFFLIPTPLALAGPNPALCVIMETNYNNCVRHDQWRQRGDWDGRRPRAADCNAWLMQLKGAGCFWRVRRGQAPFSYGLRSGNRAQYLRAGVYGRDRSGPGGHMWVQVRDDP